ncbi:MAG: HlyD family secretion protein [Cardiobacteriaceae bacterium]|nr:HlyD family secretion protein [Cardiobacteriaceae bacterium]
MSHTEDTPDLPPEPVTPASDSWQPPKRSLLGTFLFVIALIAGVLAVLYAWKLPPFTSSIVSTNNAYVRGHTTPISPKVSGYVKEVLVGDFADVKAGQALVKIDDAPYAARVAQAEAGVAGQESGRDKIGQSRVSAQAGIDARKTAIHLAEVQRDLAAANLARINSVRGSAGIAKREIDQAVSALEQAEAALAQAKAQYTAAEQDILGVETGKAGVEAGIDNARAMLALARIDLDNTTVFAPADGKLGEIGVKTGQFVTAGSQLMFIVPPERWIIANFKEADTANIRRGQTATIRVDALPGLVFHGKVGDMAPASTAEFSIIRADSGSGNFVKVAQRIAVKILLDDGQPEADRLLPGMSVEASVETQAGVAP